MSKQNPQRRRIRLPAEVCAELGMICSITIAVQGRAPVFACPAVAAAAVAVLRRHAAANRRAHRRVVRDARPRPAPSRASTTYEQTSFWDGVLRVDQRLEPVVEYVLNSPVRSGLVERWCEDRFSGSREFGLAEAGGGLLQLKLG